MLTLALCRLEQAKVANDLEQLQQALIAKESQMARVMSDGHLATLKSHYDRVLGNLQAERDELQKERLKLLQVGRLSE